MATISGCDDYFRRESLHDSRMHDILLNMAMKEWGAVPFAFMLHPEYLRMEKRCSFTQCFHHGGHRVDWLPWDGEDIRADFMEES